MDNNNSDYQDFKNLCYNLNAYEHLHIPSPSYQKRRAAVAAIIRCHPSSPPSIVRDQVTNLDEFFEQDWVKYGQAEILFMQRASRESDRWSGHVSFVGGKNEPGETDEDTVKREVLEEIGIDLNQGYLKVGQLDEREITSVKDNKLLMMLSPFVYLQVVPESPPFQLQTDEVAAVEWVPLSFFTSNQPYANHAITEYLTLVQVKNRFVNRCIRFLMGSVTFPAVHLPTTAVNSRTTFKLWGLTLGMTSDIIEFTKKNHLAFLKLTKSKPTYSRKDIGMLAALITQLRYFIRYGKMELDLNSSAMRIKAKWDKVYWSSIRLAIIAAILLRLGFTSLFIRFLINKVN
ncbi:NUDIX family hydrolase [Mucor ambiguus]|uniref:NUDIX family hydrolase n=1 Tax=Mucor ambiguus TaxID=91626 RepID=A0A0C9MYN5_9FUNG|nr:NUDIX family hydrolase [Mucor ambiguus]